MKRILILYLLILSFGFANENYWQQKVHYDINVVLIDTSHTLIGDEHIQYINNSPDTLSFIWMHLWPNAYKNDSTALARQKIKNQSPRFAFAPDSTKGFIDITNVRIDSSEIRWTYRSADTIDVAKFYLNAPLFPNDTIDISMNFTTRIPVSMSRFGHIGNHYEITQWFPKPAVYDMKGWWPMSYLDTGEFYSEWGSFDVKISVPENYRVASTGVLHNASEIKWLDSLATEGNAFVDSLVLNKDASIDSLDAKAAIDNPVSSKTYKTLRYTQDKVHDFAWFADKRFIVSKKWYQEISTSDSIATWLFIIPNNLRNFRNGHLFIREALEKYGQYFMLYPYSQCTVIDGDFSAGGGMEYPMITVINNSSDEKWMETVIVHEVGHNWFYGLSGNNERDFPWQDEGLNTYGENRTMIETHGEGPFYVSRVYTPYIGKYIQKYVEAANHLDGEIRGYYRLALMDNDQAGDLHSEIYTDTNYGAVVYSKVGHVTRLLEKYLGASLMDSAFHTYFDEWAYKHPQPEDLREVFERISAKDLSWFFDVLLGSNAKLDYELVDVYYTSEKNETEIIMRNNGEASIPIPLFLMSENDTIIKWIEPFENETNLKLWTDEPLNKVVIDPEHWILDINPKNNQLHIKPEINHFNFIYNPGDRYSINILPYAALSSIDLIRPGIVAFHQDKLQWDAFWNIAINYGFESQKPSIAGEWKSRYQKFGTKMGQLKIRAHSNYISNMAKISFKYLISKSSNLEVHAYTTDLFKSAIETFHIDTSLYDYGHVSIVDFIRRTNYQSAFVDKYSKFSIEIGHNNEKKSIFEKFEFNWDYIRTINPDFSFEYNIDFSSIFESNNHFNNIPKQYASYLSTETDPTFENIFILSRRSERFLSPGEGMSYGKITLPGFLAENREMYRAFLSNSITLDFSEIFKPKPFIGYAITMDAQNNVKQRNVFALKFNSGPIEIFYPLLTDIQDTNAESFKRFQVNLTMTRFDLSF